MHVVRNSERKWKGEPDSVRQICRLELEAQENEYEYSPQNPANSYMLSKTENSFKHTSLKLGQAKEN